ncbi:hypothetical protein D9M72_283140 [compost metagenome]
MLAQLCRQRIEFGARDGELFFLLGAALQRFLQAGMGGLLVDGLKLGAGVFQGFGNAFGLVGGHLDIAAQLVDAAGQVALGKEGFLRGALEVAQLVARARELAVQRLEGHLLVFVGGLHLCQRGVVLLEAGFGFGADGALLFDLCVDLVQFLADLAAPGRVALHRLRQLEHVHLQRVHAAGSLLGARPGIAEPLAGLGVGRFGTHRLGLGFVGQQQLRARLLLQVFDFLLARQHAGLLGIGGVDLDGVAAHQVALGHDERRAVRQRVARGQRLRHVGGDIDIGQPVLHHGADAGLGDLHQRHQRAQAGRRFQRAGGGRRRVKRQLGRRRVGQEGLDPVQVRHFQRGQLLAQHGFERVFPARLDMDLLPQARQLGQLMLGQPRLHLAVGLHVLLQLAQRRQARLQRGDGGGFAVHARLRCAARFVQARHALFGIGQHGLGFLDQRFLLGQLGAGLLQAGFVGAVQALFFRRQAFAALFQLLQHLVGAALLRGFELQGLLGLHDAGALLVEQLLRVAPLRFQRRQFVVLMGDGFLRLDRAAFGHGQVFFGLRQLVGGLFGLALPLLALPGQRGDLGLHAIARFHHVADLGFELADFGIGLIQRALRGVHAIGRPVVRGAHGFQLGLDVAQLRGLRFQVDLGLLDGALVAFLLLLGLALAQQPQQVLLLFAVGVQRFEALRHLSLAFQFFEVAAEFAQDVFDAGQVLARVGQAVFGLAAAFLVLGHARGFFQEDAHVIGLGLDDARDHALPDDGVGARAQARAQEDVLDVAPAHRLVVDVVGRSAVAGQHALDRDFGVLAPLAGGAAFGVVEHQFDAGPAGLLARRGTVEDHVLHGLAAQLGSA